MDGAGSGERGEGPGERVRERAERHGYLHLAVDQAAIRATIHQHPQFAAFLAGMDAHFAQWRARAASRLKALAPGFRPKALIAELADDLLAHYQGRPLVDAYAIYQHLLDYWAQAMQDDAWQLAAEGWLAKPHRLVEKDKKGKQKDRGWACDLVPKPLVVARWFAAEQRAVDETAAALEAAGSALDALVEEHSGEEMAFAGFDKINAAEVKSRLREIEADGDTEDAADELAVLREWLTLAERQATLKKTLKAQDAELDAKALAHYAELSQADIQSLVVDDKWLATLADAIGGEVERAAQSLTARVRELALRYEKPLPVLVDEVAALSEKVQGHLARMGVAWN